MTTAAFIGWVFIILLFVVELVFFLRVLHEFIPRLLHTIKQFIFDKKYGRQIEEFKRISREHSRYPAYLKNGCEFVSEFYTHEAMGRATRILRITHNGKEIYDEIGGFNLDFAKHFRQYLDLIQSDIRIIKRNKRNHEKNVRITQARAEQEKRKMLSEYPWKAYTCGQCKYFDTKYYPDGDIEAFCKKHGYMYSHSMWLEFSNSEACSSFEK